MTRHRSLQRCVAAAAAAALITLSWGVRTATPAAAASWTCAYTYVGGQTAGKACFNGRTAQVCDLRADGIAVYGSFSVRGVGVRSFSDANGAASPCSYQTYQATIGSASAYTR